MAWEDENFVCEHCEQPRELETELIFVPCPNFDDDHAYCVYCVKRWGTEEFKKHITEHGSNNMTKSGKGIDWDKVEER